MKARMVMTLIQALMTILTPELVEGLAKMVINWARTAVLGSASKVDDAIVLPLLDTIENAFGLDD